MYHSQIESVRFGFRSDADIVSESAMVVTHPNLHRENKPADGGPCDTRLGSLDRAFSCSTCFHGKKLCPGHSGAIPLRYPIVQPFGFNEISRWAKVICLYCGQLPMPEARYEAWPAPVRLSMAAKTRNDKRICQNIHCQKPQGAIRRDKVNKNFLAFVAPQEEERILYPHILAGCLGRISPETVTFMGCKTHPAELILSTVTMPSMTLRLDAKKTDRTQAEPGTTLTPQYVSFIKANAAMPDIETIVSVFPPINAPPAVGGPIGGENDVSTRPPIQAKDLDRQIVDYISIYYQVILATKPDQQLDSMARILKGKKGLFRRYIHGRRCHYMSRSTITDHPTLPIDAVAIPLHFAMKVPVDEVMQDFSRERLMIHLQNGSRRYPGAIGFIKRSNGKLYDADRFGATEIENGDIVLRHRVDGDYVIFNRQPSLTSHSTTGHYLRVLADGYVIGMNPDACQAYGADFDGDQMTLACPASVAARNEVEDQGSMRSSFISPNTSAPSVGEVNDAVLGLFKLTQTGVTYSRYHASLLFRHHDGPLPDLRHQETFTGRELVSLAMKETPINFSRGTNWYRDAYAHLIRYDPLDKRVVIRNGKLQEGVLDSASLAGGSTGNLFHIVAKDYGSKQALRLMYNLQQIGIAHLCFRAVTTGLADLVLSDEAYTEIAALDQDCRTKAKWHTSQLQRGEIVPPIGHTVSDFYEAQQKEILKAEDGLTNVILRDITRGAAAHAETNHLLDLIGSGTKGKISHLINMNANIGQRVVNGERAPMKFAYGRSSPFTRMFDPAPLARGYLSSSYLRGMNVVEYVFAAQEARRNLISKSMSTSKSGVQNRNSVMNLQGLIVDNLRHTALHDQHVCQWVFGEDYMDPKSLERVKYPPAVSSDAEFVAAAAPPAEAAADATSAVARLWSQIQEDRRDYRRWFRRFEHFTPTGSFMSEDLWACVNVPRIIENCRGDPHAESLGAAKMTLEQACQSVLELCDDLRWLPRGRAAQAKAKQLGRAAPDFIKAATWPVEILCRYWLSPKMLLDDTKSITLCGALLWVVIDKIKLIFVQSLVAPGARMGIIAGQAYSEPLVQNMLSATHGSAARGSGSTTAGITGVEELLGARPLSKLKAPFMRVALKAPWRDSAEAAQGVAETIELKTLGQFVMVAQIFNEPFGNPQHPDYEHEAGDINRFLLVNSSTKRPSDLVSHCIRLEMNKEAMMLKGVGQDLIVQRILEQHPNVFLYYTPDNQVEGAIIRVWIRAVQFKDRVGAPQVETFLAALLKTPIRGFAGLLDAEVVKIFRSETAPVAAANAGAVVKSAEIWGVRVSGSNVADVCSHPAVDPYETLLSSVSEVLRLLGVEAARLTLISSLRQFVPSCQHRHLIMYADEMLRLGVFTAFSLAGLRIRDPTNAYALMVYSDPKRGLEDAVTMRTTASTDDVVSALSVGSTPTHGTLYNEFYLDEEFVRQNTVDPNALIDAL